MLQKISKKKLQVLRSSADTHTLIDRGDTCYTLRNMGYRQQELAEKDDSLTQYMIEQMTEVFVEQPRLHWVC